MRHFLGLELLALVLVLATEALLAASGLGCAARDDPGGDEDESAAGAVGQTRSPDAIASMDDPERLLPGASMRLADNIEPADVGKTFGVDDAQEPYPDTYWPYSDNGTDVKWKDLDPSPLDKYVGAFDAAHRDAAKGWENRNHGTSAPNMLSWWGHCPGWTNAAMLNAPLTQAVYAKDDGEGGVQSCVAGEDACTRFEIGDVNALMAEAYLDGRSSFIGARCGESPSAIPHDGFGRIVRDGSGCKGLNAGSLLVVLGRQLKTNKRAFGLDAQDDANTDQIWNQPAYRYVVYRFEPLTTIAAANLVATGAPTGTETVYVWNTAARGFALVDLGIEWVSEYGPNALPVSGAFSMHETRVVAVIELSDDPANPDAVILGGEYLNDASVGADRLTVPPFVWIGEGAGPEDVPLDATGASHNPYVKPSIVRGLVALGQGGTIARAPPPLRGFEALRARYVGPAPSLYRVAMPLAR